LPFVLNKFLTLKLCMKRQAKVQAHDTKT